MCLLSVKNNDPVTIERDTRKSAVIVAGLLHHSVGKTTFSSSKT